MKKRKSEKKWIEIAVRVHETSREAVSELFDRLGEGGAVTETVPAKRGAGETGTRTIRVKAYLPSDRRAVSRRREVLKELRELRRRFAIPRATVRTLTEAGWSEAWQKHFKKQTIGKRIIILPTRKRYTPRRNEVVIRMDPGMAFGTGLHSTTRLCLMALESRLRPGDRVLDIGTGSGILAIAAVGLGADHVTAIDIESDAVQVARKNVARNGVAKNVTLHAGTLQKLRDEIGPAHLIVVNILAYTIINMLPDLKEKLRPGGWLIGGGILKEFKGDVTRTLSNAGFNRVEWLEEEDWLTFATNAP